MGLLLQSLVEPLLQPLFMGALRASFVQTHEHISECYAFINQYLPVNSPLPVGMNIHVK